MSALIEFLHMGGYAFYVWTSYAIVTIVLAGNVASAVLRRRRLLRELSRRERMEQQRAAREAT